VSRHGAREPTKLFNFTKDPTKNFNSTGELMPMGRKQHFDLGKHLRGKYVDGGKGFLSSEFNPKEVQVRSTYTDRTYLSSIYQIMGMYPEAYPQVTDYTQYGIGSEDYLS
jgi:hypothetical protein